MQAIINNEKAVEIIEMLDLSAQYHTEPLAWLVEGDSRYLSDLKMNLKTVLKSEYLSEKETALLGLAAATNENNDTLIQYFARLAQKQGATAAEIAETTACTSLLSSNNVLYRFRHFTGKEKYHQLPARMRMNIMMNPVLGKEFFELVSLAVSAINGCQMCVNAHEHSVLELGAKEERIFDAIRLVAVVVSVSKIIR